MSQAGKICIDGVDIRTVQEDSLLAQVGIVPQETILFSGTVRDNIRYGRPEATEEEVIAAAKAAQAHDFILQLAAGLRYPRRRARRKPLGRAKTAHRHRPRPDHAAQRSSSWMTAPVRWMWKPKPKSRMRWKSRCATIPVLSSRSASAPC